MSLRLKLIAIALFGLAAVAAYTFWKHHVEQLGAAKVEARDAKLALEAKQREIEQIERDFKTNEDAINGLRAERERLARDLAARPVPSIRLCVAAPSGGGGLSAAAGAPGAARESAAEGGERPGLPGGDSGGVDIGSGVQLLAVVAERVDAQLRAMQKRELELQR